MLFNSLYPLFIELFLLAIFFLFHFQNEMNISICVCHLGLFFLLKYMIVIILQLLEHILVFLLTTG